MNVYLLDSCVVIDVLRGRREMVEGVRSLVDAGGVLASSDVTIVEVMTGMRESERETTMAFLKTLHYLPLSFTTARRAGDWRCQYRKKGVTLSTPDCLVAAAAHEHRAVLVTGNTAHYPQPELRIIDTDVFQPQCA